MMCVCGGFCAQNPPLPHTASVDPAGLLNPGKVFRAAAR